MRNRYLWSGPGRDSDDEPIDEYEQPLTRKVEPTFPNRSNRQTPNHAHTHDGKYNVGEKENPLAYKPFDVDEELRKVQELAETEDRRAYLQQIKACLIHQKEGIAKVINILHETVEETPDADKELLLSKVHLHASNYGFTPTQLYHFTSAIDQYIAKHAAVESYRTQYPLDNDLFEACFGKKPKGRVEVIKGPMTLCFRCFHQKDFLLASTSHKTGGDEGKIAAKDIKRAEGAGGFALGNVRLPALKDTVTLEKPQINLQFATTTDTKKEEIHHQSSELFLNHQKGDILIEVKGIGTWKISIVERDNEEKPLRIQILAPDGVHSREMKLLFDARRVKPTEAMKQHENFIGCLLPVHKSPEEMISNCVRYLKIGTKDYGYINMDNAFITIHDDSPDGTTIHFQEQGSQWTEGENTEQSKRVHDHEDQHQFNKLWSPLELREGRLQAMSSAVEGAQNPEEAVQRLLLSMVRRKRKEIGIDSSCRHEILAHYRDGSAPEHIFDNLVKSPLYNYNALFAEAIAKIPAEVMEAVRDDMSSVLYEEGEAGQLEYIQADPLEVYESEVLPHIDSVFGNEYLRDLRRWIDALILLEKKGYARDEILRFLFQAPVNSWLRLAQRKKAARD
jgi:hypothetical protein